MIYTEQYVEFLENKIAGLVEELVFAEKALKDIEVIVGAVCDVMTEYSAPLPDGDFADGVNDVVTSLKKALAASLETSEIFKQLREEGAFDA